MSMRQPKIQRAIARFCIVITIVGPLQGISLRAWADQILDEANRGQNTGASLLLQNDTRTDGQIQAGDDQTIFPGYTPGGYDSLSGAAANPVQITTQANPTKSAYGSGTDGTSQAYQSILSAQSNLKKDVYTPEYMRTDTAWNQTRDLVSGTDPIYDELLSSCADESSTVVNQPKTTLVSNIQRCQQKESPPPSVCNLSRSYSLEPVETKVIFKAEVKPTILATHGQWRTWVDYSTAAYNEFCQIEFQDPNYNGGAVYSYPFTYRVGWDNCEGYIWDDILRTGTFTTTDHNGDHTYTDTVIHDAYTAAGKEITATTTITHEYLGESVWSPYTVGEDQTSSPMNGTAIFGRSAVGTNSTFEYPSWLGSTAVSVTETPFNPADYGLSNGQYVIANHVLSGDNVTSNGYWSYGNANNGWQYSVTMTASNSWNFQVEATIYRIVDNGFVYQDCSEAYVQQLLSELSCNTAMTCTQTFSTADFGDVHATSGAPSDGPLTTFVQWPSDHNGSSLPQSCWAATIDANACLNVNCADTNDPTYSASLCQSVCVDDSGNTYDCTGQQLCWQAATVDPVTGGLTEQTTCQTDNRTTWINNLGDPGMVDSCGSQMANPDCTRQTEKTCVEGMENGNSCYLYTVSFECGESVTYVDSTTGGAQSKTCEAAVRCIGDECANTVEENNQDFVKAATASQTIQQVQQEMQANCTSSDPESCIIFEGQEYECLSPTGAVSDLDLAADCCEDGAHAARASGTTPWSYVKMLWVAYKIDTTAEAVAFFAGGGDSISGYGSMVNSTSDAATTGYNNVSTYISDGWNSTMNSLGFESTSTETEVGAETAGQTTVDSAFSGITQYVMQGCYDVIVNTAGEDAAKSIFTAETTNAGTSAETTEVTGFNTSTTAGSVANGVYTVFVWVMWAYMIYQLVKMILAAVIKCDKDDYELGQKREAASCHYIGSYCAKKIASNPFDETCIANAQGWCCFSGPFARILNEQIRLQLGEGWGSSENPDCHGFALSILETLNWDTIDLSEWEAIMFKAGIVPNPDSPPQNYAPTMTLPGAQSGLDGTGSRDQMSTEDLVNEQMDLTQGKMDAGRTAITGAQPTTQDNPDLMVWY